MGEERTIRLEDEMTGDELVRFRAEVHRSHAQALIDELPSDLLSRSYGAMVRASAHWSATRTGERYVATHPRPNLTPPPGPARTSARRRAARASCA